MRTLCIFGLLLAALGGCALVGPAGGGSTGAELPTGVTLLESDEDRCAGVVHVDEDVSDGSAEVVLRPGQNAAFEVDDDEIAWTCIGESTANEDELDCPDATSHVRITRPTEGETFLVECYGEAGG